jgi:hypothetical protein
MNFESYLSSAWTDNLIVPVVLTVIAVTTVLGINWRKIRIRWLEWRTAHGLDLLGIKQIKNAVCADGLDGEFEIDRLVLLHDSILLIAFRPYVGNIYCAEGIPEWTQVLDQKSYKFKNPLFELENQLTAIRNYHPGINIHGLLIFDHNARFPKGRPQRVILADGIPETYLRANCPEPKPEVLRFWDALQRLPLRGNQIPLYQ